VPDVLAYLGLCVAQALAVAAPARRIPLPRALRHPAVAVIAPCAVVASVAVLLTMPSSSHSLAVLAGVTVPPLAIAGVAVVQRRPLAAALVLVSLPAALLPASSLAAQLARLVLIVLACATLGALFAAVTPRPLVELGVLVVAVGDSILVAAQQIGPASNRLHAAAPVALPPFQDATLGGMMLGFGDIFLAAVLGAVLTSRERRLAALVTGVIGAVFGLLLLRVSVIPATVPVLAGLVAVRAVSLGRPAPRREPVRAAAG
jgi:prepilin signal peptidase PulO-like enzyme (type II secretory pathway)